jgi:hypothetical protein
MKHSWLIGGALLSAMVIGGGAGCQGVSTYQGDRLDDTPVPIDPAIVARDWELTQVEYAPTGIYMTPTLYSFQSRPLGYGAGYSTVFTELPLFGLNVLLMPIQIFAEPVWKEDEFRALTIPPTYTGMPPLPPPQGAEPYPPAPPAPEVMDAPVEEPPPALPDPDRAPEMPPEPAPEPERPPGNG